MFHIAEEKISDELFSLPKRFQRGTVPDHKGTVVENTRKRCCLHASYRTESEEIRERIFVELYKTQGGK